MRERLRRLAQRRQERSTALIVVAAVMFAAAFAAFASAIVVSRQAAKREARVFGSTSATAFREGACDRALRLVVAGLPGEGALPSSFQSRPLQDDLSFFGSAHDCTFRLALAGHNGLVSSAAFSPDGASVVTSSWDGTARVWNAQTGAVTATLSGHKFWVNSAAFSPGWRARRHRLMGQDRAGLGRKDRRASGNARRSHRPGQWRSLQCRRHARHYGRQRPHRAIVERRDRREL